MNELDSIEFAATSSRAAFQPAVFSLGEVTDTDGKYSMARSLKIVDETRAPSSVNTVIAMAFKLLCGCFSWRDMAKCYGKWNSADVPLHR